MRYLFIGGIKDAEYIEVPDNKEYWEICIMDRLGDMTLDPNIPMDMYKTNITREVYKKHPFYGRDGNMYYAFVYKDTDVMEMLLNGYRKGKRRSKKNKLY